MLSFVVPDVHVNVEPARSIRLHFFFVKRGGEVVNLLLERCASCRDGRKLARSKEASERSVRADAKAPRVCHPVEVLIAVNLVIVSLRALDLDPEVAGIALRGLPEESVLRALAVSQEVTVAASAAMASAGAFRAASVVRRAAGATVIRRRQGHSSFSFRFG